MRVRSRSKKCSVVPKSSVAKVVITGPKGHWTTSRGIQWGCHFLVSAAQKFHRDTMQFVVMHKPNKVGLIVRFIPLVIHN